MSASVAIVAAGAVDAWLTPILMKKGRPAHCLSALAPPDRADDVAEAMLRHTTTLGVRTAAAERVVLQRGFTTLTLDGEPVRVKVAHREGRVASAAAEFVDVQRVASTLSTPEREVLARAEAAIVAAGWVPGAALPGPLDDPPSDGPAPTRA